MRMIRSVAAILAGLGFMAATVTAGGLIASMAFGGGAPAGASSSGPPSSFLVANLATCGLGAVMGGWLAARFASYAPYGHAAVMAAIVAALSIGTATGAPAPGQPGWYPSALGLVAVLGVLAGGKLRAAAAGPAPGTRV